MNSAQQITAFDATIYSEDLINDISYDYYGKRLATCSTDAKIKVFDSNKSTFQLNEVFKAHDAPIQKLSWAHPSYGQIFASCSQDRSIKIWQESDENHGKKWIERAKLTDCKGAITCIQFSPVFLGLKLASIGIDGILRIYEAIDVIDITNWTLVDEFEVCVGNESSVFSLSWCSSRFQAPAIVVGCNREAKIYRLDKSIDKWISSEILTGHNDLVLDVCWAPDMGKNCCLIATACRDNHVRIFKLKPDLKNNSNLSVSSSTGFKKRKYTVDLVADLGEHFAEVWKVEWNITGTVLSSSCDDGKIRLWKASFVDDWKCIGVISSE